MKESDIQSAICDYLAARKHFFWRSNNIPAFNRNANGSIQMRRLPKHSMRGIPDIIVVEKGVFIGIEVKTDKGHLSPDQIEFGRECIRRGGQYITARSIDDVQNAGL